jgi:lipoyl-dependent peroxiredoxin
VTLFVSYGSLIDQDDYREWETEAKMTTRNGSAEWHGNLESGSGTITVGEGVFEGPYSYESRFAEGEGTNPEQLIAAAHAGCFTMALSNILSTAGHAPDSVHTNVRVHLRNIDGQPTLARVDLDTEGHVTGIDDEQFQRYADEAKANCPVSRALAGIPEIGLSAKLVSA